MESIFPYCSRPMHVGVQPAGKRICSSCGLGIRKRHKWTIGSDGRLRHRDCHNPTGKIKSDNSKGLF